MRKSAAERAAVREETRREIAAAYAERAAHDEEGTRADRERLLAQLVEVRVEQARIREQARALLNEGRDLMLQADRMGIESPAIADALGLSRQWVWRYLITRKAADHAKLDEIGAPK